MQTSKSMATQGEGNKARLASSIGLIIRQKEPKVLETPVDTLNGIRATAPTPTSSITAT